MFVAAVAIAGGGVVITVVLTAAAVLTAVAAAAVVVAALAVQLLPLLLLIHSIYCTDLTVSFHFFSLVALQCTNPVQKLGSRGDCHSRVLRMFQ